MNDKKKNIIIVVLAIIAALLAGLLVFLLMQKNEKWVQKGSVITKGDITLNVGDYYDYDETNNGEIEGLVDVLWRVLGVDESGDLLVMSTSNIENLTLGSLDNLEKAKDDYVTGALKMDELVEKYGHGQNAKGARTITAEDTYKIINYTPSDEKTVTNFYWSDAEKPIYQLNGEEAVETKNVYTGTFHWYDEEAGKWNISQKDGTETKENPKLIVSQEDKLYKYLYSNYTHNEETGELEYIIDNESGTYKMLFLDEQGNNANYWVNHRFISSANSFTGYGYLLMKKDGLNYAYQVYSMGIPREVTSGVRAVVTID